MTGTLLEFAADPRDTPIYSVAEVAAMVDVPRSTLRHWLRKPKSGRALIECEPRLGLSFYNLLEVHILKVALQREAWLQRIRAAVEKLRLSAPGSAHPLLERDLFTASGYRSLFATTVTGDIENLSSGGQLEFRQFLKRYLDRIDYDTYGPYQLRPFGCQHIAINHRVSGGRPVVKGTGILVELLARRRRAGETPDQLAKDYNLTPADVREAIRYAAA
ncbi:MAG TPA: DUF433 domain-containing protein [Vicinamibacterales bacterium]|jgi:uncharacterized protein (DUF433 family)